VERISASHTLAARSGHLAGAERVDVDRSGARPDQVTANLIIMIGAVIAGGGLWLLLRGGTPHYILSGTAYVVSGVQLWRRRPAGPWLAVAAAGVGCSAASRQDYSTSARVLDSSSLRSRFSLPPSHSSSSRAARVAHNAPSSSARACRDCHPGRARDRPCTHR
jgi:hypothetical protein